MFRIVIVFSTLRKTATIDIRVYVARLGNSLSIFRGSKNSVWLHNRCHVAEGGGVMGEEEGWIHAHGVGMGAILLT